MPVLQQRNADAAAAPLRTKIAQFESKGGVPVPRAGASFGISAPPAVDRAQQRRGLYANRMKDVWVPNVGRTPPTQHIEQEPVVMDEHLPDSPIRPPSPASVAHLDSEEAVMVDSMEPASEEAIEESQVAIDKVEDTFEDPEELVKIFVEGPEEMGEGVAEDSEELVETFIEGSEEMGDGIAEDPDEMGEGIADPEEPVDSVSEDLADSSEWEESALEEVQRAPSPPPPPTKSPIPTLSPDPEESTSVHHPSSPPLPPSPNLPPLPPTGPVEPVDPPHSSKPAPRSGTVPTPRTHRLGQSFSSVVHTRVREPATRRTPDKRLPLPPSPRPRYAGGRTSNADLATLLRRTATLERRLIAGELPASPTQASTRTTMVTVTESTPAPFPPVVQRADLLQIPRQEHHEHHAKAKHTFRNPLGLVRRHKEESVSVTHDEEHTSRKPMGLVRRHKEDSVSGTHDEESTWYTEPAPTTFSSWRKLTSTTRFTRKLDERVATRITS